jgi:hypothetical protein
MNAALKNVFDRIERLPPQDQTALAVEIERRLDELWLKAELEKGEASGGERPMNEMFDRLAAKYGA